MLVQQYNQLSTVHELQAVLGGEALGAAREVTTRDKQTPMRAPADHAHQLANELNADRI
jgi:hypothetical protein